MNRIRHVALAAFNLFAALQLPAEPAAVNTGIDAVTVYADRARVTRSGAVTLAAGPAEYAIRGLPSWVDEESLRASVEPAEAARIVDVRVAREYLAQAADDDVRAAEKAVREIEDQIAELADETKVQDARARQVEEIRVFSMEKLPREAPAPQVPIEAYGRTVEFVAETLRSISDKRREIARRLRDLEPEHQVRRRSLADLQARRRLEYCAVTLALDAPSAAPARLRLEYLLPGATWEPQHEMRAAGAAPTNVALATYAIVSQTTGEDWTAAALAFSTQSPDQVMKVPEVEALRLGGVAPVLAADKGSSFSVAQERFNTLNRTWFQANGDGDVAVYEDNWRRQSAAAQRSLTAFTQLELKRGTTAHFAGEGRPAVRADGRQVRVPIGRAELPCRPRIVAAPEVSLNATHTAELRNSGAQPLLPGRVGLFREGAFIGTTDLPFVAEGEEATVLMGVADRVKLSRVLDRRQSALVRGHRTRMQVAFDVGVENLSPAPAAVRLLDRVPVSENRDIRVYGVSIDPRNEPDSSGRLAWDLELKPGEKRAFRIEYTIEYPSLVALRDSRRPMEMAPAAPAGMPVPSTDLYQQIEKLENKF
jgi:uncharacterized protein (TIGR02231 family)